VYRHLAKHLEDAGKTPPPLKSHAAAVHRAEHVLRDAFGLADAWSDLSHELKRGSELSQSNRARVRAALDALKPIVSDFEQWLAKWAEDTEDEPDDAGAKRAMERQRFEINRTLARVARLNGGSAT
jgi:hypothetical protein